MRKFVLAFLIVLMAAGACHAVPTVWFRNALTGGSDSLDDIDGDDLEDGYAALVVTASGAYLYSLNASSGAAESSPGVIAPDTNAGSKRWILQAVYGSTSLYQAADADLTDLADGSLTGSKVGSGISGSNITAGTVDETYIDADIARDSEVPTVSDNAYDGTGWNGNTNAASKNAIRDKIETLQAADADLDDLADGSLSGSKVGSGIDAANITTGELGISIVKAKDGDGLALEDDGDNVAMFVEDGGQVGFGTATPSAQVEVFSSTDADVRGLLIHQDSDDNKGPNYIQLKTRATGTTASDGDQLGNIHFAFYNDNATPELIKNTSIWGNVDDASDGSEDTRWNFRIYDDGSEVTMVTIMDSMVGINDTSPAATLDVGGTVRADAFSEYSPIYVDGAEAIAALGAIRPEPGTVGPDGWGDVDHDTLPPGTRVDFVETWTRDKRNGKETKGKDADNVSGDGIEIFQKIVPGRDIGKTVQLLQAAVIELSARLEALEKK